MDLCPDPNLCKILVKCYNERKTDDTDLPGNMAITVSSTNSAAITAATLSLAQAQSSNINTNNENLAPDPNTPLDECLVCSDLKRDTVFKVMVF